MSDRNRLRDQRRGTVINVTSKKQEADIIKALYSVVDYLGRKFSKRVTLSHEKQWYLKDIVSELRQIYPDTEFHHHFPRSSIRPDGGILFIESAQEGTLTYPILISEVKNQGTNDLRAKEGLPKQSRGNAIERLGKK